jgi:hypothetical protein
MILEQGADPTVQDKDGGHHSTRRRDGDMWKSFG